MHFSIDRTVHTTAFDKPVVDLELIPLKRNITNPVAQNFLLSLSLMLYWEGRKEMFYLTTHSTRLYGVRPMVMDQFDSERENPLPPLGLLFPISSKSYFICTIPQTG